MELIQFYFITHKSKLIRKLLLFCDIFFNIEYDLQLINHDDQVVHKVISNMQFLI